MFHLSRTMAILSTLLMISCATTPSGQTFDSAIGVWNEKHTTMSGRTQSSKVTIIDEAKGAFTYSGGPGRLEFYSKEDQRTWKGYWIIESGHNPCTTEKGGSQFWGEQIFHFNETYNTYTGTWNSCGEGTKYSARGVR